MGFKSGLNRVLFASRARGLRSGAEKATAMTPETRALACGIAKKPVHGIKKQTLLRRISRATRRLEQHHEARIVYKKISSGAAPSHGRVAPGRAHGGAAPSTRRFARPERRSHQMRAVEKAFTAGRDGRGLEQLRRPVEGADIDQRT